MLSPFKNVKTRLSLFVLILANLIPIAGVLYLDWDVFDIVFLYWIESAIVGFYTILRFIGVAPLASVFLIPFFMVHYGMFMTVHFLFVYSIFGDDEGANFFIPPPDLILELLSSVLFGFAALFLSHGFSFFYNFMHKKEYLVLTSDKLMQAPYKRVIVLHMAILLGAFVVIEYELPIVFLALLVLIKIAFDMYAHSAEHAQLVLKNK